MSRAISTRIRGWIKGVGPILLSFFFFFWPNREPEKIYIRRLCARKGLSVCWICCSSSSTASRHATDYVLLRRSRHFFLLFFFSFLNRLLIFSSLLFKNVYPSLSFKKLDAMKTTIKIEAKFLFLSNLTWIHFNNWIQHLIKEQKSPENRIDG